MELDSDSIQIIEPSSGPAPTQEETPIPQRALSADSRSLVGGDFQVVPPYVHSDLFRNREVHFGQNKELQVLVDPLSDEANYHVADTKRSGRRECEPWKRWHASA